MVATADDMSWDLKVAAAFNTLQLQYLLSDRDSIFFGRAPKRLLIGGWGGIGNVKLLLGTISWMLQWSIIRVLKRVEQKVAGQFWDQTYLFRLDFERRETRECTSA